MCACCCAYMFTLYICIHTYRLSLTNTHKHTHTHTYTYDGDATVTSWSLVKALIKERANVVLPAPTSPLSRITSPSCATSAMDLYGCVEESEYVHVHVHVHMHVHMHVHVHVCVCVGSWINCTICTLKILLTSPAAQYHVGHRHSTQRIRPAPLASLLPAHSSATPPSPHPPADTTPSISLRRQGGGCGLECTTLLRPALQHLLYASSRQ